MINATQEKSLKAYFLQSQFYLSTIIMGTAIVGIVIITTHIFRSYSQYNLQLLTHVLASEVQTAVMFNDQISLKQTLDNSIQKYPLTHIAIMDNEGNILSKVTSFKDFYDYYWLGSLQSWLIPSELGHAPIHYNGKKIAELQIDISMRPLINFFKLFALMVVCCGAISYLITQVSTRLIYRKINQSLQQLTSSTDAVIKHRNFQKTIPSGYILEFNKISNSFNVLLQEVHVWHTHLEQQNSHLEHRALHDTLTMLPNRAYFNQHLNFLFENNLTRDKFALLYIDNNDFKSVNDSYGHQVGDLVLREMAQRLKNHLRTNDFIARIGGDEFAVLLHNVTLIANAIIVAQNLIRASHQPIFISDTESINASFSIGIALSNSVDSIEQLIHQADLAMYKAKLDPYRHYAVYTK